ncbi:hypothetical protein [Allorhizocola rhizosphaerae]|uniref:hypothetical protein n=1 Tax=Allorhizocola rhizosphaerae TaxID=1872709 RepID=UPI0013C36A96|nr:hypothetical protein [Allorhizocola rhizosphaerae]
MTRACNGGAAEADINPRHGTFTGAELAITGDTKPLAVSVGLALTFTFTLTFTTLTFTTLTFTTLTFTTLTFTTLTFTTLTFTLTAAGQQPGPVGHGFVFVHVFVGELRGDQQWG